MTVLLDVHLDLLVRALGLRDGRTVPYRSTYLASEQTLEQCMQLQAAGYLQRAKSSSSNDLFSVTDAGRVVARQHLLSRQLEGLVSWRVSQEASIAASERVGPNSQEYERLCERLEDDPKVVAGVYQQLVRELFELAVDLRDALEISRPYVPDEGSREHQDALTRMHDAIGKINAMTRCAEETLHFAERSHGSNPEPATPGYGPVCFAVFEFYPEQPVAWKDERGSYILVREDQDPARYAQCERMSDGRMAVLKTKMGSAMRIQAERAAQEIGGLVVEVNVHSDNDFPTNSGCFDALSEWCQINDAESQCDAGPAPV